MNHPIDLSVTVAGLRLNNPVIAASGTFGYGLELEPFLDLNQLGGFVVKGLSREPMPGNPPPRLVPTPGGMLNSVGLQNIGVKAFVRDKLPRLARFRTAVIANVFGYETQDYVEVVRQLEEAPGLAAYELNLSCPNTRHGGITFGSDLSLTEEVTAAVKKLSHRPVWVKLSPNVTDIGPFAQAAEAGGADAICLANTFLGMQLPHGQQDAAIPGGAGGLSGPAIHPLAVRLVYDAVRTVHIPVLGIGGILSGADAAEFLRAGAVAVQVGTANLYDPLATIRIIRELEAYCHRRGIRRLEEFRRRPGNSESEPRP